MIRINKIYLPLFATLVCIFSACTKSDIDINELCNLPTHYSDMTADRQLSSIVTLYYQNGVMTNSDTTLFHWTNDKLMGIHQALRLEKGYDQNGGYRVYREGVDYTFTYTGTHITGFDIERWVDIYEADSAHNILGYIKRDVERNHGELSYSGDFLTQLKTDIEGLDNKVFFCVYDDSSNVVDLGMVENRNDNNMRIMRGLFDYFGMKTTWDGRNLTTISYSEGNQVITYDSKINPYRCIPREAAIILHWDIGDYFFNGTNYLGTAWKLRNLSRNNPTNDVYETWDYHYEMWTYHYDGDYPSSRMMIEDVPPLGEFRTETHYTYID